MYYTKIYVRDGRYFEDVNVEDRLIGLETLNELSESVAGLIAEFGGTARLEIDFTSSGDNGSGICEVQAARTKDEYDKEQAARRERDNARDRVLYEQLKERFENHRLEQSRPSEQAASPSELHPAFPY